MKAYFVGGGIGSLAGASFMIRDANVPGSDITIFEQLHLLGGSLDAAPRTEGGYSLRGGRMLTIDHYECTWDLYKTIPSIQHPGKTVYDETVEFNQRYQSHSQARLVDHNRHRVDVSTMGFTMKDRLEMVKLAEASEETLGASRITDWLSPEFFNTNFWLMWQTTFAFQPWHSAVELKRYLHRFMNMYPSIQYLGGVKRTVYNQYDALVRPLVKWLKEHGVKFVTDTRVTDLDLSEENSKVVVRALKCTGSNGEQMINIEDVDLVFLQNGSMTDASSIGSMTAAPAHRTKADSHGWELWEKIAQGRPEFGKPEVFNMSIPESYWLSFTTTCLTPTFFQQMETFSGNEAGTGGLVTFKDSNWFMSVVLYHQPHFIDQPADQYVFWGYGLHPDRAGNFVAKSLSECTGAEILQELSGHLNFDQTVFDGAICYPARMPYITSMFMPRARTDRPLPVPKNSKNLAFISQFVEIPDDVVFTVEYSVRAAQMAVYELLNVNRAIPPVTRYDQSPRVLFEAAVKSFE